MISAREQGSVIVLERAASRAARGGCGCAVIGTTLLMLTSLAAAIYPSQKITLDCDRGRGTCTYAARKVPLSEIQGVALVRDSRGGRSYRVYTVSLELTLAKNEKDAVCTAPRDDPTAKQLATDVERMNAFLHDPSQPTFATTCMEDVSTVGERIYYPIVSILFFVGALFGLRLVSRERFEFDATRRVLRRRGSLGSRIPKQDFAFAEIEAVELENDMMRLRLRSAPPLFIAIASNAAERETLANAKRRIETLLTASPT